MKKASKVIQWILAVIFALCTIANGFHWTSLPLLLATILLMPLPEIRILLDSFKIKGTVLTVLIVVLVLVGILNSPLQAETDNKLKEDVIYNQPENNITKDQPEENGRSQIINLKAEKIDKEEREDTANSNNNTKLEELPIAQEVPMEEESIKTEREPKIEEPKIEEPKIEEPKIEKFDSFESQQESQNTTPFETYDHEISEETTYILNTNTMKFHYSSCRSVKTIKPKNYGEYTGTRDGVIARGYDSCGICHP